MYTNNLQNIQETVANDVAQLIQITTSWKRYLNAGRIAFT